MCQLTVLNFKDKKYLMPFIISALKINTNIGNKDGYGVMIFNPTLDYHRSEKLPNLDEENLLNLIKNRDFNTTILHVRAASSINGKKIIQYTKNHPFVDENNIATFHNGSLNPLGKDKIPENMTDTEYFHVKLLERIKARGKENYYLPDLVKEEYDANWEGKFAFIFVDIKNKSTIYVFKGSTASLFIAKIYIEENLIGFILNTEKHSLIEILESEKKRSYIYYNEKIEFNIEEIKDNAGYVLDLENSSITEIGVKIEEKIRAAQIVTYQSNAVKNTNYYRGGRNWWEENDDKAIGFFKQTDHKKDEMSELIKLMDTYLFTLLDLDFISRTVLNLSLLEFSETDLDTFSKLVILPLYNQIMNTAKKVKNIWKSFDKYIGFEAQFNSQLQLLENVGLKYPFHLNSREDLLEALIKLEVGSHNVKL